MKRHLFILTAFFLNFYSLSGQLSGSYTVGGPNDDFTTIQSAIDTLTLSGISGNTTLLIKPGLYSILDIENFNLNGNDTLTILPQTIYPNAVVFENGNIEDSRNVTLKYLSFSRTTNSSPGDPLVNIQSNYNILVTHCRMTDTISKYSNLVLRIPQPSGPNYGKILITHTNITAQATDSAAFMAVSVYGDGESTFYKDTIVGRWNMGHYGKHNFYNSYFVMGGGFYFAGEVDSCTFFLLKTYSSRISATKISNSVVTGYEYADLYADTLINNVIGTHISVHNGIDSALYYRGNIFLQPFTLRRANAALITNNKFYSNCRFSFCYGGQVSNNFFFDQLMTGFGSMSFSYNNFGPASLFINNYSQLVANNNINQYKGIANVLVNNNYISNDPVTLSYSHFDTSASYYDPGYADSLDLHISNPAIFSRGFYIPSLPRDIDGDFRTGCPAIGADENCLNQVLPDSIFLQCGSVYKLNICSNLLAANYQWKPGNLLVDSTALFPEVLADSTKLIWLVDNSMNIVDSVWIVPENSYQYGSRVFYPDCGYRTGVGTYVPPGATVSWSPPGILDNPDSNFVTLTLKKDTQIVATINHGHCGIFYDTVDFKISTIPTGYFLVDDTLDCRSKIFYARFPCRDSLEWDFGDGTISKNDTVMHTYSGTGSYQITLTIWMFSQKLEIPFFEIVSCIDLLEIEDSFVGIYPNPAKSKLNIEVKDISPQYVRIYDVTGKVILKHPWEKVIDIPQGILGLHIIEVEAEGKFYRKKVFIDN